MSDDALPSAFFTHFQNLSADAFAIGWAELATCEDELRRAEAARGWPMLTGTYYGGLADAYKAEMRRRGEAIIATLKEVHRTFGTPLAPTVDEQLVRLASETFAAQSSALQAAYERHISRIGAQLPGDAARSSTMQLQQAAQSAAVPNAVRRYLWELRNVPRATASPAGAAGGTTINVGNVYGAVLTGANATTSIAQQWDGAATADLTRAIDRLREVIESTSEIGEEDRSDLREDLDAAKAEVSAPVPRTAKVLRCLGAVGGVVQTLGSAREAWQAVQIAARAAGVPLP